MYKAKADTNSETATLQLLNKNEIYRGSLGQQYGKMDTGHEPPSSAKTMAARRCASRTLGVPIGATTASGEDRRLAVSPQVRRYEDNDYGADDAQSY